MNVKSKRKPGRYLTTIEIIAIHKRLGEVLEIVEDRCRYHSGWTDLRVAQEFNCSNSQIMRVRRETYGDIIASEKTLAGIPDPRLDKIEAFLVSLDMGYVK